MSRDTPEATFRISYEFLHFSHGAVELGVRTIDISLHIIEHSANHVNTTLWLAKHVGSKMKRSLVMLTDFSAH